jgi:drug/metabolite transporter (DMT)-like permease
LLTNQVLSWNDHLSIALKGLIVSTSWMFAYLSLKHLPISIVSPIRASGPLWTLMGAVLIYGEIPTALQGFGFLLTMVSYIFVSILGQKEGIRFSRNPWIACIVMGTLVGALSGLYDKYLIAKRGLHPTDVQLWFSVHMVWVQALMLAIAVKMKWEKMSTFQWRWSMAIVGVLLLAADAAYFRAITDMEAQIGLLSGIRRASLLFSFGIGAVMFKDKNLRKKALPVLGVFMGIVILSLSSSS